MASELSCELTSCAAPAAEPTEGNYFVAAYPPFSCWRPELAGARFEDGVLVDHPIRTDTEVPMAA